MKILIIDDSEEARFCMRAQFGIYGHEIVGEADTLAGATGAYQKAKPDLVVLDMSIGKLSGIDVLKALRQLDPAARVVVLSANQMERLKKEAAAAGAAGYLIKPVDMDQLLAFLPKP